MTTALLLAAGRGVRLAPLTDRVPKAGLPLLDIPLGAWALSDLATLSGPLFVNASIHADALEEALRPFAPDATFLREEPEPLGSAGTVAGLRNEMTDVLIVRAADHLTDLKSADLLATHRRLGRPATVAVAPVVEGADFEIDGQQATRYVDRRVEPEASGAMWIGAIALDHAALALIPAERPLDLATALLGQLTRAGELGLHVHKGYQLDLGVPNRYLRASIDLLYGRGPRPPRELPGELFSAGGGRAYVGPDAQVESASLGPDSIVLQGGRVPRGSTVARALVMPHETVPHGLALSGGIWAEGRIVPALP